MPRLVNADALIMRLNDWALGAAPMVADHGDVRALRQKEYDTIEQIIDMIADAPIVAIGELFSEWARQNGTHVCATCGRASANQNSGTRCPIEEHYALPVDGHCHLWEEVKPGAAD